MKRQSHMYAGALVLVAAWMFTLSTHAQTSTGERAVATEKAKPADGMKFFSSPNEPRGDTQEVEIIQALDRKTDLVVNDAPIQEALAQLAEGTDIPLVVKAGTMDLLPYGSKTALTATIEDLPLRDSLAGLLWPVGLTFEVKNARVVVIPTEGLARLGRRATWDELATLKTLYTQPWTNDLTEKLSFRFREISGTGANTNRDLLQKSAQNVGEGSAADVLTLACERYGWTWYPERNQVVILPKTKQVERQLEKRVSLQYSQIGLREALLDLADRAGVLLEMDPGVFAELPPQTAERFSLRIENATVRQALEVVAGQTGLKYTVEPEGIRLTGNALPVHGTLATTHAASTQVVRPEATDIRTNPIVGQITKTGADGTQYSFFIRLEDLPPEMARLRQIAIEKEVVNFRKLLEAEQPQD